MVEKSLCKLSIHVIKSSDDHLRSLIEGRKPDAWLSAGFSKGSAGEGCLL